MGVRTRAPNRIVMSYWNSVPPILVTPKISAHAGILTGHWEFDLALLLVLLAVVAYSFLLPADAPKGMGRRAIQGTAALFFIAALALAVVGFRSL